MSKKLFALCLAACLLLSFAPAAFAVEGGTLEGEGALKPVVLEVDVPMNLDFALDPLEIDAGQIDAPDFIITNESNVKVLTAFYLTATLAGGTTIGTGLATDGNNLKWTVKDKKLEFSVLPAKTIASGAITESALATTAKVFADDAGTIKATVGFLLAAGNVTPTNAGFKLTGVLNAYAEPAWAAGDISISGVYLIQPLAADTAIDTVTDTTGLVATTTTLPAAPTVEDFVNVKLTGAAVANDAVAGTYSIAYPKLKDKGLTIQLNLSSTGHPASITSAVWGPSDMTGDYTYDVTTGILTYKVDYTAFPAFSDLVTIVAGGQTFKLNLSGTLN
ncbi:MAG: hypothetical protein LBK56_07195 [Gracilibacteraceae bacterium]|jgi:hypothetical protein|nr:hypothetical protein [Gracilibacteraceae bacterium]